jgi:hypothetical protein
MHYCALIIDRRPFPRFLGVLRGRRVSLFWKYVCMYIHGEEERESRGQRTED